MMEIVEHPDTRQKEGKGWVVEKDGSFILQKSEFMPALLSNEFLLYLTAAFAFSGFALWRKLLTWDGALAASFLGLWVVYAAGIAWLLPLFFFFLSGSLMGKWLKKEAASDEKAGKARDAWQVVCNGGIYGVLAGFCLGPWKEIAQQGMLLSMAISTADTWSSEIGIAMRGRTWDVLRWKPLSPGLSGGVSWQGSLAGIAGALAIGLLGLWLLPAASALPHLTATTLFGTAGMLFDSVLGAALQARYVDPATGFEFDYKAGKFRLSKGYQWMTNDWVNLLSNLIITTLGLYLLL
jgi:uncharacterized protein (TIGR00297 family)